MMNSNIEANVCANLVMDVECEWVVFPWNYGVHCKYGENIEALLPSWYVFYVSDCVTVFVFGAFQIGMCSSLMSSSVP